MDTTKLPSAEILLLGLISDQLQAIMAITVRNSPENALLRDFLRTIDEERQSLGRPALPPNFFGGNVN